MEKKRMFRCLLRQKRDGNYFLMMRLTIVLTFFLTMNVRIRLCGRYFDL